MTTVVYRDGVLAADRLATVGDYKCAGYSPKLRRLSDGRLAACLGAYSMASKYIDWLEAGSEENQPGLKEAVVIVVELDGSVIVYEDDWGDREVGPFLARGTGRGPALGALYMGASAERAVEIAALVDIRTGGGVDVLRLGESDVP